MVGLDMVASGLAQGRGVPGSRSLRRKSAGLAGAAVHAAVFPAASASGWRENTAGMILAGLGIWESLDYK